MTLFAALGRGGGGGGDQSSHVSDSNGFRVAGFVVPKKRIWPASGPREKVFNGGSKKAVPGGAAGWTKAKNQGSIKPTFLARFANPERIPRIPRAQGMARRRAGGATTWGRAGPQTMDAAAGGAAAAGTAGRRHLGAGSPPPAPLRSPPPLSPPPPPPAGDLIPDPRLLGPPRSRHGSLSALQFPRPPAPGASRGKEASGLGRSRGERPQEPPSTTPIGRAAGPGARSSERPGALRIQRRGAERGVRPVQPTVRSGG